MIDSLILKSKVFKIIEEKYLSEIRKEADFIYNICHKYEY